MSSLDDFACETIAALRRKDQWRRLRNLPGLGGKITVKGRPYLNFSSNDYLDLATSESLKRGACEAIEGFGCGAASSRLMTGQLPLHEALERGLAALTGLESALVLPSGYQTNVAVLSTLAGKGDHIFSDALNHASIIDGCRLSGAEVSIYGHGDVENLEELLQAATNAGRKFIVSDALFSMDGDLAPVVALDALAKRHGASLVIDEAHAIGVFGEGGGLCKELGVRPDVLLGTLSKALGSGGGFVACSAAVRELLINRARGFIFSTGLAPGCAGSALAAVQHIERTPELGSELLQRAAYFKTKLEAAGAPVGETASQVLPILVGENAAALHLSQSLFEAGLIATAIRPPSVPEGTARLRLSVTLAHTREDLDRAAALLSERLHAAGAV